MDANPYEPPKAESAVPSASARGGSRGVRLSVFLANCFLLLLFPPTCCPCGFGPIGFIIQPYLLLLGFPTILVAFVAPEVVQSCRGPFFVAYIVNYVVVSYLVGEVAGRICGGRRVRPDAAEDRRG